MNLKVKILGLSCLAALAAGALVAVNASATAGGHFTSNRDKTTVEVIEQAPDKLELVAGMNKGIVCEQSTYHGVFAGKKVAAITLTPKYAECLTTGGKVDGVTITTHDCVYEFTARPEPATKHNTMHIKCPAGKKITIVDTETLGGTCTIEIGPQTISGVLYKKIQWQGTDSITAEFTAKNIQYTLHFGACSLLGTTFNDGELKGSVIMKAWNADKPAEGANIEAT